MESSLIKFVEPLGPGQIIDRQSVASLPSGRVKISMHNHVNELRVCVISLQELCSGRTINQGSNVSAKAFLSVDNLILEGREVTCKLRGVPKSELSFDKREFRDNFKNSISDKIQILQVCVYASRKNALSKSFLGTTHISVDDVWANVTSCCIQASYKVFPRSSFLVGCPLAQAMLFCINESLSKDVSEKICQGYCEEPLSLAEESSVTTTINDSCPAIQTYNESPTIKSKSFRRIARIIVKMLPAKQKDKGNENKSDKVIEESVTLSSDFPQNGAEDSICSTSKPGKTNTSGTCEKLDLKKKQTRNLEGVAKIKQEENSSGKASSSSGSAVKTNLFRQMPIKPNRKKTLTRQKSFCVPKVIVSSPDDEEKTFRRSEEIICATPPDMELSVNEVFDNFIDSKRNYKLKNTKFSNNKFEEYDGKQKNSSASSFAYNSNTKDSESSANKSTSKNSSNKSLADSQDGKGTLVQDPKVQGKKSAGMLKSISFPSRGTLSKTRSLSLSKPSCRSRSLDKSHSNASSFFDPAETYATKNTDDNVYDVLASLKNMQSTSCQNVATVKEANSLPPDDTSTIDDSKKRTIRSFSAEIKHATQSILPAVLEQHEYRSPSTNRTRKMLQRNDRISNSLTENLSNNRELLDTKRKQDGTSSLDFSGKDEPEIVQSAPKLDKNILSLKPSHILNGAQEKRNRFAICRSAAVEMCDDKESYGLKLEKEEAKQVANNCEKEKFNDQQ